MPFLEIVMRGRGIPKNRLEEVAHHYEIIGGASPINAITRAQAQALEKHLAASGHPFPVYIGQRNWNPFIEETLRKMQADGIRRAVGFITAAHQSEASLERYINAVELARERIGPEAPIIDYVDPWFDHPLFIEAIAARVEEVLAPNRIKLWQAPWHFTAHSIPCSMAKESTYVPELQKTAELVCARFSKNEWHLAYSSRSGNPRDPWLEPDVCDVIKNEAGKGHRDLLYIPIGFVADHVEILFDLDIEAQEAAREAKINLQRSKTVGDHPLFIQMMAEVIVERMKKNSPAALPTSLRTQFRDGRTMEKVGQTSETCYCRPGVNNPPCQKIAQHV